MMFGRQEDWEDERYMDWADQERLVQQDLEEINKRIRRRKAGNYEKEEHGEDE